VIPDLVAILLALALLMLAVRKRASVSWVFTAYLATCLVVNRMIVWWPATFQNYGFWWTKEILYVLLKLAVVFQIGRAVLSAFARARHVVLVITASIAIGTWLTALTTTDRWVFQALSVAQAGVVWGLAALLIACLWFQLPLHPLHRAILLGFALYLGVYGATLGLVRYLSLSAVPYLSALDSAAYAATVGLWLHAAARPYEGEPAWPRPRWLARRPA